MAQKIVKLPLFESADYFYNVSLENISYRLRFCYNERMQQWIMDIRFIDRTPVILGEALVPEYPLFVDYSMPFTGFFWLSPIGDKKNQTITNPFEIGEYYELYYVWEE